MKRALGSLVILLLLGSPLGALECVIFDWAVPPGVWSGSGDEDLTGLLMTSTTRWTFHLAGCSLTSGTCDAFGSGSVAYQDGVERPEWYSTSTVPAVVALGNSVAYGFSMVGAFVPVPIINQPRHEDLDWTLLAELPTAPPDSPSSTDLLGALGIAVNTTHHVYEAGIFTSTWTGTATNTVFTSCNPPVALLTIDDVALSEGSGGGTTGFTFTVSRDTNAADVEVTVDTADGSATADDDYTAVSGTVLSFPAGGTLTRTVTVDVAADDSLESDEDFTVVLSAPVNATLLDGTGLGTIQNDDTAAALSIDDVTLTEGSGGGGTSFGFTISRTHNHDAVSVEVQTADGSAAAGSDYTAIGPTSVDFAAGGSLSQPVTVTVSADGVVELDEGFTVELSSPTNATFTDSTGVATIVNDDDATLSISGAGLDEGSGGGTSPLVFDVTLDLPVDHSVTVDWATFDDTAQDENGDGDYLAGQGTLQFDGSGGETRTITVQVVADERPERDESFFVDLSGLTAGGRDVALSPTSATGSILDDDDACPFFGAYRQPFDSPPSPNSHPATSGDTVTFENVVDGGGATTSLPSGPISGIRLWGLGMNGAVPCALDPAVPFDLHFTTDAAGVPGANIAQRSGVAGQLTELGSGIHQIDLFFATFDGAGVSWISVERAAVGGCAFEWLAEETASTYDDHVFVASGLAPDDAYLCLGDPPFFADGFESGDVSGWSATSN